VPRRGNRREGNFLRDHAAMKCRFSVQQAGAIPTVGRTASLRAFAHISASSACSKRRTRELNSAARREVRRMTIQRKSSAASQHPNVLPARKSRARQRRLPASALKKCRTRGVGGVVSNSRLAHHAAGIDCGAPRPRTPTPTHAGAGDLASSGTRAIGRIPARRVQIAHLRLMHRNPLILRDDTRSATGVDSLKMRNARFPENCVSGVASEPIGRIHNQPATPASAAQSASPASPCAARDRMRRLRRR